MGTNGDSIIYRSQVGTERIKGPLRRAQVLAHDSSHTVAEIETHDGVLVVRCIHVTYQLGLEPQQHAAVERAHVVHHDGCPAYRTIKNCVAITTSLEMEDL